MKKFVMPALVLTVICVVVAGLVSGASLLTRDAIAAQEASAADEAKRSVLPAAAQFVAIDEAEAPMQQSAAQESYKALDAAGETIGFVFVTTGTGYGGEIRVMTGLDAAGVVTGVVLLSDDETPGLGKKAEQEDFRAQYVGKDVSEYTVVKGDAAADGEISAITSATITSRAVTSAVNDAKAAYAFYCAAVEEAAA